MEDWYKEELIKVKDYLNKAHESQARQMFNIAQNQYQDLQVKNQKLKNMIESVDSHIKDLHKKLTRLQKARKAENEILEQMRMLAESIQIMEEELKRLQVTKKDVYNREADLMEGMETLVKQNKLPVSLIDRSAGQRIKKIFDIRKRLLGREKDFIEKEVDVFLKDKNIFFEVNEAARKRLYYLNKKIDVENTDMENTIKKRQLLLMSHQESSQKLKAASKKKLALEKQFYETISQYGLEDIKSSPIKKSRSIKRSKKGGKTNAKKRTNRKR